MKSFTDLFIKRPVLALVVSFVILIAGLQAMRTINVRQYPRRCGTRSGFYHNASRARDRGRRWNRLYPVAEQTGAISHHCPSETELRREQSIVRYQLKS